MANQNTPYNTEASMNLIVPNVSQLVKVFSPECLVGGIPWKLCISEERSFSSIGVYLHCCANNANNQSLDWSHTVRAEVKLLRYDGSRNAVKYCFEPFVFDKSGISFGTKSFVTLDYLFSTESRFVKDDKITLNIRIVADDINEPNRSELIFDATGISQIHGSPALFRLKVSNIHNLMAVRSPQIEMGNLPWNLTVYRGQSDLCVRLTYCGIEPIPYEVAMTTTLMSRKKTVQNVAEITYLGSIQTKLISWEHLMDPYYGFISNNSIVIYVEIKTSDVDVDSCPINLVKRFLVLQQQPNVSACSVRRL